MFLEVTEKHIYTLGAVKIFLVEVVQRISLLATQNDTK